MNPKTTYELSNPQKRIWYTEVLHNHLEMSNIGYLIYLKGEYDLELLARAIKYVVKVNDSLQLRFQYSAEEKGELLQFVPDFEEVGVKLIEAANEAELLSAIEQIHRERFDITGGYLCSFVVFSVAKKKYGLFESAHHLVADGISAIIVARETIETYKSFIANDKTNLGSSFL